MKLENCGRCGLEPLIGFEDDGKTLKYLQCRSVCSGAEFSPEKWNAAQFAARTERINAAAVAIWGSDPLMPTSATMPAAERLIDAQDAAARVRWAEMQGGE